MFTRFAFLAVVGLTLCLGACSGKTADERDSLLRQNKELQDKLDAEHQARADAESRASATANVAPAATVPTTPEMTAPETATGTGTGAGTTDLGGGITVGTNKHGQKFIHIPSDVLFDSGKAALKPAAKKSLDKVAAIIKKDYKGQQLRVEGHTDPNPVKKTGWDDNWDLGAARARSVLLYLIEKGVAKKDMYIASFADNDLKSTKNYALNRRVDIVVTGGK
ncbi:MAG: OmpA family protein [Phycisphaerales bacterium]|nr:OmpA family protein [Phycisphaerales bacterium]